MTAVVDVCRYRCLCGTDFEPTAQQRGFLAAGNRRAWCSKACRRRHDSRARTMGETIGEAAAHLSAIDSIQTARCACGTVFEPTCVQSGYLARGLRVWCSRECERRVGDASRRRGIRPEDYVEKAAAVPDTFRCLCGQEFRPSSFQKAAAVSGRPLWCSARCRGYARHVRATYGITLQEIAYWWRIEICERPGCDNPATAIDHCHTNGHIRGRLCTGCNTALGFIEKYDVPALLAYVEMADARAEAGTQ